MSDHKPLGLCTALATLPREDVIDAEGLAKALNTCKRTVLRQTSRGELPAPFRLSGRFCWKVGTVLDHFAHLQDEALRRAMSHGRRKSA